MDEEGLSDQSFWARIVLKLPELQGDQVGTEFVVDRFVGQYLPALLSTRGNKAKTTYGWLFGTTWSNLAPAGSRSV